MKKRILSLLLAGCMVFSCAHTALAGAADDQALMAVTAKVKQTLDLNTDLYETFHGDSSEDALLGTRWRLNWTGDGVDLSITADSDGKIYSYNARRSVDSVGLDSRSNGGRLDLPRLPKDQSSAAFETAKAFLSKVLEAPLETVQLSNNYRPSLYQDAYYYNGTILLNSLTSPISCHITVRASDLTVLRFDRDDVYNGYLGSVPAADTTVTQDQARRLLRSTVKMELKYILQDDGKTARVQYVPVSGNRYFVDGVTGKLVDLTELYSKIRGNTNAGGGMLFTTSDMAANDAAPEASMKQELSRVEQEGAAILSGAMSKEELDRVVKNAWPEIGLDKYTLAAASYSTSEKEIEKGATRTPQDYDVTCRLTYGKQISGGTANKYIVVDAKTGELKSLRSGRSYAEKWPDSIPVSTSVSAAQATAQKTLASFAGANAAKLALADTDSAATDAKSWQHTFTFQHTANGYFYAGNSYIVGVDATDGTISSLSGSFDEKVELVKPAKMVDLDTAIDAYVQALTLNYGYLDVPVSISLAGPQLMPLLKEAGYEYVFALKTAFVLDQPEHGYVSAVDAETGKAVKDDYTPQETPGLTYDDVEGHWVQTAALALAQFEVGFRGGSLKPSENLTQRDMLALLLSVEGYTFEPESADKDEVDQLYDRAYSYGLVTPETRSDLMPITRGMLVKTLLDAVGYDKIAALPGIFRCDYTDANTIPADQLGYAALAQGLGLVKGNSLGQYAAAVNVTRAEALAMVYQYMK